MIDYTISDKTRREIIESLELAIDGFNMEIKAMDKKTCLEHASIELSIESQLGQIPSWVIEKSVKGIDTKTI